jgi:hypothetical protein
MARSRGLGDVYKRQEYYQYRLNKTEYNKEGIKAMKQYLRSQQKSNKSMV